MLNTLRPGCANVQAALQKQNAAQQKHLLDSAKLAHIGLVATAPKVSPQDELAIRGLVKLPTPKPSPLQELGIRGLLKAAFS